MAFNIVSKIENENVLQIENYNGELGSFFVDDVISFNPDGSDSYTVVLVENTPELGRLKLNRSVSGITAGIVQIYSVTGGVPVGNAVGEFSADNGFNDLVDQGMFVGNLSEFEMMENSITFSDSSAKLKFISRNPGSWGNGIDIAIALPSSFVAGDYEVFRGIALNDLFEYAPTGSEIAIIIRLGDVIEETFIVDIDPEGRDSNGKSSYVETVINNQSNLVFVKDNTLVNSIEEFMYDDRAQWDSQILEFGEDVAPTAGDLLTAYELWDNKEEVDIDIVIGNEADFGVSAKKLVDTRKDCIAFIGAPGVASGDDLNAVVGKKASTAVQNLIKWRTGKDAYETNNINYNNMFVVACGNYKYQYDRYNDKNRWVNIAGDIAGLRAQTSTNRASWWASAGLERGQIKNVIKLAFNPSQAHRDILYKNGINPICSFPGQGTVMWGQKTLLDKPSSFDRVNVRGLFNTLERSLSKMAKYQVMEFNDNFTRNRIISMIKPFLSSVQAGRGIQDFLVVCDTTNNTPDVISRNQLVVDVYIKPTYVAEFVHLKFTNAGTNSFSEVIGGA